MTQLQNIWRQLVQRRLWPVALLLLAALVAVPVLLAGEPELAPAPPPPAAVDPDSALATQPIVTQASLEDRATRRRVLGRAKDPFATPTPTPTPTPEPTAAPTAAPTGGGPGGEAGGESGGEAGDESGGGSGGGSEPAPSGGGAPPPAATPTPEPAPTYAQHELTVRFGGAEGDPERMQLERLAPLPSKASPMLIYLGVLEDGKTAVFLLKEGVVADGDGDCRPTPASCETVHLQAGETEFFDVPGAAGAEAAQYQLDLLKIHTASGSAKVGTASADTGRRGLQALRASAP